MLIQCSIRPAFGVATVIVAQPCGCWELNVLVGPVELKALAGRWCRNRNLPLPPPPGPLDFIAEGMRRSGAPEWKVVTLVEEAERISRLPMAERGAALLAMLRDIEVDPALLAQIQSVSVPVPPATQPERTENER
jgi:hypothetical protein